jgi:hypothetical protein
MTIRKPRHETGPFVILLAAAELPEQLGDLSYRPSRRCGGRGDSVVIEGVSLH